jgi:branched-chain amino acid transport system permease protein
MSQPDTTEENRRATPGGASASGGPGTGKPRSAPRRALRAIRPRHIVYLLLLVIAANALQADNIYTYELSVVLIYVLATLGQDWLVGRAGQVSIGAAAFMAVGAFTGARVAEASWGVFPLPLIAAALVGGGIGLVTGITGLRFRGLYLLLSTLALQFIVSFLAQEYEGQSGGLPVPAPHIGGLRFAGSQSFVVLELAVIAIVMVLLAGLYKRGPGRIWDAIRQDEMVAAVIGINTTRWRLTAFVGSSAVTAMAGALLAYQSQLVSYPTFSLDMAISVLVMVFIGGRGSMLGAILGATLVELLPFELQQLSSATADSMPGLSTWLSTKAPTLDDAVYGLVLLLILLFERDGLVGLGGRITRAIGARIGSQAETRGEA